MFELRKEMTIKIRPIENLRGGTFLRRIQFFTSPSPRWP